MVALHRAALNPLNGAAAQGWMVAKARLISVHLPMFLAPCNFPRKTTRREMPKARKHCLTSPCRAHKVAVSAR